MSYSAPDVYYQPESFGLTKVIEIDDPSACYSFDILAVWKHDKTNKLYVALDSGCSCPSPFESYTSLDDLDELTSLDDLEKWLDSWMYGNPGKVTKACVMKYAEL